MYVPVQDNAELEDGDANHLGQCIFVRQTLLHVHVAVRLAIGILYYFLGV